MQSLVMLSKMKTLQGSIVAIVTPFTDDDVVDYAAYEKLVKRQLENGTAGIVVCGTTGESPTLTEEEYEKLIKLTAEVVQGKVPVIAGAGTNSTAKSIHNCEVAKRAGADGLLVVGPYYNKPSSKGFYLHFKAIAAFTDLPIILYNVPGRTGKNIPTDIVLKLAGECKNIFGIKEASGDMAQITDILNHRPQGFRVYSGDDALTHPLMALGADGCISVVANEIPREFSEMIRLDLAGKSAEALALHTRYLDLMNMNFIETNPQPVKTALAMMGLIRENFRLPLCTLEEESRKKLQEVLAQLELI